MHAPRVRSILLVSVLAACGPSPGVVHSDGDAPLAPTPDATPDAPPAIERVDVQALGVQGFVVRYGGDTILTAPLFTRQSTVEVGLNLPLAADTAAIDAGLAGVALSEIRAIVTGHAHYDHFMDVPHVMDLVPDAVTYTNMTGRNVLAALAPDRPAGCTNTPGPPVIERQRVIALDDPLASHTDYTNCPDQAPPGVPLQGTWLQIPHSHVRIMSFCSMHPDQIGPFHFGKGSIDTEQCDLPAAASGWLEGQTLGLLIDFLDDTGHPKFRVFYQDAPTNAPIGFVPPAMIAEHTVDLALLCVGSNDAVTDEPTAIIDNLQPRFVLSGHWEDFFQPSSAPPQPIIFLDVNKYVMRAEAALPGVADRPISIDGTPSSVRHVLMQPGMHLSFPFRP